MGGHVLAVPPIPTRAFLKFLCEVSTARLRVRPRTYNPSTVSHPPFPSQTFTPFEALARTATGWAKLKMERDWGREERGGGGSHFAAWVMSGCSATLGRDAAAWDPRALSDRCRDQIPSPSPSPRRNGGTHPGCRRVPRREASRGGRDGFGTEQEEEEEEEDAVGKRGAATRPAGPAPAAAAAAAGCKLPAWRWGWMGGGGGGEG